MVVICALVQAGADIKGSVSEWAPFDASYGANAADAMATLVEFGADLTRINQDGLTPLQLAVKEGYLDAVNVLLMAGAGPNQESGKWLSCEYHNHERGGRNPDDSAPEWG